MQPGDTVESLPNTPLTTDHLDDLTDSDRIELTIPIITFFDNSRGTELVHQFVLRFKTVGYVLQYADERGWVVQERAAEDEDEYGEGGESPYDGLTEELLFLAQVKGQQLPDDNSEIPAESETSSAMNGSAMNGSGDHATDDGDVTDDAERGSALGSLMATTGDPDVDPRLPLTATERSHASTVGISSKKRKSPIPNGLASPDGGVQPTTVMERVSEWTSSQYPEPDDARA